MMKRSLAPLGIALAMALAACGAQDAIDGPSAESIEQQLASPDEHYTMDAEQIPSDLRAEFGALDEATITTLDNQLADLDLLDNDDALAETSLPTDPNAKPEDPSTQPDPNAKPPIKLPDCPRGFIKGKWKHVAKGFGVFKGAFVDRQGALVGWVRGVYGHNRVIGKVTRKNGQPYALLTGVYHGGHFRAALRDRDGRIGALRGRYGNNVFKGKWIRFCKPPVIVCPPNLVPHASGLFCVPPACKPGSCGKGMFCDLCPPVCKPAPQLPAGAAPALCGTQKGLVCPKGLRCERDTNDPAAAGRCVPERVCVAVCGQPVCRPLPPLPPKPAPCASTELGGKSSCKPSAVWRKYAEGICTAKKRVLGAFAVAVPCGKDLFRLAKLTCCEKPSTAPGSNTPAK